MYSNLFDAQSIQDLMAALPTIPYAIWETFYVTVLSTALSLVLGAVVMTLGYSLGPKILGLMNTPESCMDDAVLYIKIYFAGAIASMLYNMGAGILRAMGDSRRPTLFLMAACGVNIVLDCLFMGAFHWGVRGAALATVISQYLSGLGLAGYTWKAFPALRVRREDRVWNKDTLRQLLSLSGFTCLQQSVMNFGILMVQGLVNSFGTTKEMPMATA